MRDRLLVRHFLWRFLEHDLIAPNADRHAVLSLVVAMLVAVSLFLTVLIAAPYQFFPDMPPGLVSLRSLDERFFFASASMLVLALVAVAQWDALALDARDTAALGVLPLPRALIVRTKVMAVALLALGTAVAWNLPAILLRFVSVPSGLGVSLRDNLVLTVAHGVTTIAAGAFGFLVVVGLREVLWAIMGQAAFRRISAVLQGTLTMALVTALLLLPGTAMGTTGNWLARGELASKVLPPFWFVGLHEAMAGSVIDSLPRTPPPGFLRLDVAERDAIDLYRSLWPLYNQLALTGLGAFIIAGIVAAAACMWNGRRLPMPVGRRAPDNGPPGRAWSWVAAHVIARSSLSQAGLFFTLQTLGRQVPHRVALASSLAVGLSLVVLTVQGRGSAAGNEVRDVASLPVALLAGQSILVGCVLGGLRHAVRIPAELRASTTFSLAWAGNLTPYMSGVKRAGWLALVLPTLGGLFIWHATVLGTRLATLHLGVGLVVSALLMETLFARYRVVPFVSPYVRSREVSPHAVMSAAVLMPGSFGLAVIERMSLGVPTGYLMLVATMIGLTTAVRVFDRASRQPEATLDLDEPQSLPTQRLNLVG